MNEIIKLTKNKELVVKKRVVAILEKVLGVFGIDFGHDRYKQIIYEIDGFKSPQEEQVKKYYDAFMFLLNNKKTAVSADFISRFYYLAKSVQINENLAMKIASKFFYLNDCNALLKAVHFHLYIYELLKELDECERTLFSIMFLNFTLVHEGIPCIHMVTKDYERYFKYRRLYFEGKIEKIIEFIKLIILNGKYQSKDFYKSLKPLTLADIKKGIIEEKKVLVNDYKIKSIIVFGSFAKNDYRLDSDIDLLVMFEDGISLKERVKKVEDVKTLLFNKFNRYIDIHEIFKELPDFILKETTEIITIYKEEKIWQIED